MAIRVIRSYRIVLYEAAITLGGMIPYKTMAEATAYNRIRDIRSTGIDILKSVAKQVRTEAIQRAQGSHEGTRKRNRNIKGRAQTSSESDHPALG